MPTCKACGEEITWIRTRAGKKMPVDADSFAQHEVRRGVTVVTEDGVVFRGKTDIPYNVSGYIPHWQTCQFAEQFRRR